MATVIDDSGFTRDRLDIIKANADAAMRQIYGENADLTTSSPDGQYTAITSEAADTVGQLAEDVFNARSPANASGAALSRLVRLAGIARNPASYSTADVVHTGTPGTVIPDGSLIDTGTEPAAHFRTVGDATIGSGGSVAGTVRSTTTGPVFGAAGAISVIKTVISGWTSVTNAAAVNLGSDQETDAALRVRFRASAALSSKSVIDGLYAALANVAGVSDAAVFENKTGSPISRAGATDLPPNSIQAVVRGGLDASIAAAIWAKASGGVTLVGATTGFVTDAQGNLQAVKYDRPTRTDVYVVVSLKYPTITGAPPSDALKAAISKAVADFGNATSRVGAVVVRAQLNAPVLAAIGGDQTKPSATRLNFITIGLTAGLQASSDLFMPFNAYASWDAINVAISVSGFVG